MSKRFLTDVIQQSTGMTGVASGRLAAELIAAIKAEITQTGRFTLPDFGSFTVRETPKRTVLNPKTGRRSQSRRAPRCASRWHPRLRPRRCPSSRSPDARPPAWLEKPVHAPAGHGTCLFTTRVFPGSWRSDPARRRPEDMRPPEDTRARRRVLAAAVVAGMLVSCRRCHPGRRATAGSG